MTRDEYDALKVPFPIDSAARDAVYMGVEPNEWYLESQKDPRFNLVKAKEKNKIFPDLQNMFM